MSSAAAPPLRRIVLPGAFRPRSDTWLLAQAARRERVGAGARVLELCAGPAVAGIAAARAHRGSLTTVDVSRRAQLYALVNGALNGVRVRARRGDLCGPVRDERFDLVLSNPPYVPGVDPPRRGAARGWEAGADGRAILDRICAAAAGHLAPDGVLLLVHSEVCGVDATVDALDAAGLAAAVAVRHEGVLGPLLRGRRAELETRGLLRPGQETETVVVVRAAAAG